MSEIFTDEPSIPQVPMYQAINGFALPLEVPPYDLNSITSDTWAELARKYYDQYLAMQATFTQEAYCLLYYGPGPLIARMLSPLSSLELKGVEPVSIPSKTDDNYRRYSGRRGFRRTDSFGQ